MTSGSGCRSYNTGNLNIFWRPNWIPTSSVCTHWLMIINLVLDTTSFPAPKQENYCLHHSLIMLFNANVSLFSMSGTFCLLLIKSPKQVHSPLWNLFCQCWSQSPFLWKFGAPVGLPQLHCSWTICQMEFCKANILGNTREQLLQGVSLRQKASEIHCSRDGNEQHKEGLHPSMISGYCQAWPWAVPLPS